MKLCTGHLLAYFLLVLIGMTTIFPLIWMVLTSFRPPEADVSDLSSLFCFIFDFSNYREVFGASRLFRNLANSFFVTVSVTLGQVFTSSLAAYAFARMNFWGRDRIFLGYLATLMIPGTVTMIPSFLLLRSFGWVDSYAALILPALFSAYGTFLLRQFFLSLPRDLEEAAMIDGCGHWGIYWNVILPLARNALLTLAILTYMSNWKSLMWPLIVTHSPHLFTMPVALSRFNEMSSGGYVAWGLLMAGSVIMILPMLIVFLCGQRFFLKGLMVGAVKG